MESETPPPVSSPNRVDDLEVSSRRAPPNRQVAQETRKELPKGGASVTQGSGIKNDGPEPSGLQPETILGASKRIPSKECRTPAAVSEDPGAPEMLTASVHFRGAPCLDGYGGRKGFIRKSGLNEAFTSLLRGFEVCDIMLPIE